MKTTKTRESERCIGIGKARRAGEGRTGRRESEFIGRGIQKRGREISGRIKIERKKTNRCGVTRKRKKLQ